MTEPRRVNFTTLEQILSTDINRVGSLGGKAAMDVLRQLEASFLHTTPRDVTLRGLDANPGAGLSVDVDPGALARFDVGAGSDASDYEYGVLGAVENVVIAAADPADDRIDLIYGTPAQDLTDSTSRNVLTLPARTVSPTNVDKTATPDLTLAVVTGTPGATPAFPSAPAGSVPLWYVRVPAAAVSIADDDLMDARVLLNPGGLSRDHKRVFGLYIDGSSTNLSITSGQAEVNGAPARMSDDLTEAAVDLFPTGSGSLSSNNLYDVYLVARNGGDPVGKNVQDGLVPILVAGNAPDSEGRPSAPLTYRPLRDHGVNNVQRTTQDALYIGSAHTNAAGNFQIGNIGLPLNRDGSTKTAIVDPSVDGFGGFPGNVPSFLRKPTFSWIDADTVQVGQGMLGPAGIPNPVLSTMNAVMPTDLASGEVEQASTWYYVYLRFRVSGGGASDRALDRQMVTILSSEGPSALGQKPTPEAGFAVSDYQYVGAVFNDASSDFSRFRKDGSRYSFFSDVSIAFVDPVPQSPTLSTITARVPATSRHAIINPTPTVRTAAAGGWTAVFDFFAETGTGLRYFRDTMQDHDPNGGAFFGWGIGELAIPVDASGQFELTAASLTNLLTTAGDLQMNVQQIGFLEDVESIW